RGGPCSRGRCHPGCGLGPSPRPAAPGPWGAGPGGRDLRRPRLERPAARPRRDPPCRHHRPAAVCRDPRPPGGGTRRPPPLRPAQRGVLVGALAGEHVVDTYEALDVKGIVARAVPGWERIRNRPQRSAVHRFTVDRHQIETVLEAQRLLPRVSRPDLLLLAALLHDLGKHAGSRDHAADGAPLAEAAALHLGCEEDDARLIAALVREHLTLVDLATGRDLADPATLRALLDAVDEDL